MLCPSSPQCAQCRNKGSSRRLSAASGPWPFWHASRVPLHPQGIPWSGRAIQAVAHQSTGSSLRAGDRGSAPCRLRTQLSCQLWRNRGTTDHRSTPAAAHAIEAIADHPRPSPKRSIRGQEPVVVARASGRGRRAAFRRPRRRM
jgi:hypothetical protein